MDDGVLHVLIEAARGTGKTATLKQIMQHFGNCRCFFIDCATIWESNRSNAAVSFIGRLKEGLGERKTLILLDNVDFCSDSCSRSSELDRRAFISAIISCIDRASSAIFVGTCSSAASVDESLRQPHRFGHLVVLDLPGMSSKATLIKSVLESLGIDLADSKAPQILAECAQGFSGAEVVKVIHSYSRQLSGHLPSIDDISRHIQSHVPDRLHDHRQLSGISSEDGSSDQATFVGLDAMRDALLRRVLGEGQVEEGEGPGAAWQRRLMAAMNIQPCSGILIEGPPGCGKTLLARWIASRSRHRFKCISISCADLVHKVVGESEQRICSVFAAARAAAPCFIILDNIETVLGSSHDPEDSSSRRRTAHAALDRLLSTLLVEIDGCSKYAGVGVRSGAANPSVSPVIVIATTLNASTLDKALTRPGRLEEHIKLTAPSLEQRKLILHYYVRTACASVELGDDLILRMAQSTTDKSPAELKVMVQEAVMSAARDIMMSLPDPSHPIDPSGFILEKLNSIFP